jgi:hypothetical protein
LLSKKRRKRTNCGPRPIEQSPSRRPTFPYPPLYSGVGHTPCSAVGGSDAFIQVLDPYTLHWLLWTYSLVRTKHYRWRPQVLSDRFWIPPCPCQYAYGIHHGGMLAHTEPACCDRLRLGSVGTTTFVVSLASGFWAPTRLGSRLSTRSVPTPMSLLAPIFAEGYFTVTLSSAPLLLSTPIRYQSQCFASVALQAIPIKPSTLPYQHLPCLNPSLLLLDPLLLPPRRPGRHRLVPAVYFSSCRTTTASPCRLEYSSIHPRRLGERLGKSTT